MRALVCAEFGPPEQLTVGELPEPEPGEGEILIDVHAAGISFADTLMIRDMHQNKHTLPFAPGMEAAGVVAATGPGVDRPTVGDRVMGLVYDGGQADRVVTSATEAFRIPDDMDFVTATALSSVYLTSDIGLRWEARLASGETLLVLGASGGVGLAAVEIGKAMGATVIAGASSADRLALAREHGADHIVDYSKEPLRDAVTAASGRGGIDVVFDPVAGELWEPAFRSLDWGGRHVVVGFAGGKIPQFAGNLLLVKNRRALGLSLFHYRKHRHDLLARSADALFTLWQEGQIRPHVSEVLPLDRAAEGYRRIMDRKIVGRVVVDLERT